MNDIINTPKRHKPSIQTKITRYLSYDEIPDWMKDNDLIREYYRPQMSFIFALSSLFKWHNETINIWTHLLGLIGFSIATIIYNMSWPGFIFQISLLYTLLASVSAHLFYVVNKDFCKILWRIDHMGIAICSTGAFFPICFYIFNKYLAIIYIIITCFIAQIIIICSLFDKFHSADFRAYRTIIQLSFPIWSIVPLSHAFYISEEYTKNILLFIVFAILIEISGAIIFVSRIYEKYLNNKVNLIGSSHNIMHIIVLIGHSVFFYSVYILYKST
jgi:predicted membrane channel-forming protein YqfA (hemolysin III family)